MIYIIFSENKELLNKKISSVSKVKPTTLSLQYENFQTIRNELGYDDFFKTPKSFLFIDSPIFETTKIEFDKTTINMLLNSFINCEYDVFISLNKKINLKNTFMHSFYEKNNYFEIEENSSSISFFFKNFIKENNINITKTNLEYLLFNLENDLNACSLELLKLNELKNNTEITKFDIDSFSYKLLNANIFDFINLVLKNKLLSAKKLYLDIIDSDVNEIAFLEIFYTQLSFYYQVKLLSSTHSKDEIIYLLKANPYRIKLSLNLVQTIELNVLMKKIKNVANLDFLAKSGKINKDIIFDFIIHK